MNVRMDFKYDGSNFFGYQRQSNGIRTIQGEIETLLDRVLKEKINMSPAGRTDKGVHALQQVTNFETVTSIPIDKLERLLIKMFPKDIELSGLKRVDENFNARYSAKERTYLYKVRPIKEYSCFDRNYYAFFGENIKARDFEEVLQPIVGTHDFESFRKTDRNKKGTSSKREIRDIEIKENGRDLEIYIRGNSFLRSMIRIIMGSAFAILAKERPRDYITSMLNNPNLQGEKILAPAGGLYLYSVEY